MIQMTNERMEAYVEVLEVLKYMDEIYVEKIPQKLRAFFEKNKSKDYKFSIDVNKSLSEQNLKPKTLCILGMLNVSYWCNNEEHKQELLNTYKENDIKYNQAIEDTKVDPNWNEIFNKTETISENNEEKIEQSAVKTTSEMVEYKESAFKRFINKIKNIFKK